MSEKRHYINEDDLTPRRIVEELDKYIIGQFEAKKIVAIAVRNRIRRKRINRQIGEEITPKNILMIGPTGVGKTEIARRLSKLTFAPFLKVEATKYTEVGYVGRDVDSMIRDITETAVNMVREERTKEVVGIAQDKTEQRILDMLLPPPPSFSRRGNDDYDNRTESSASSDDTSLEPKTEEISPREKWEKNRAKMLQKLKDGKLEEREVELETKSSSGMVEVFSSQGAGMEEMGVDMKNLFDRILPHKTKKIKIPISEARAIIMAEEVEKLLDMDKVIKEAVELVQSQGIIFIDEFDKIAGKDYKGSGPDVSREGVQRDILPLVEGSTVYTKYGFISTEHILFIAAGAFHSAKPSDLIPELQGRFPLRAELKSLTADDFKRILTEPENALTKQYESLLATEGVKIKFTEDGIDEIAQSAYEVNSKIENIGARRLHTILEKILEDILYEAPDCQKNIKIDGDFVKKNIKTIIKDRDLSKFIL